jgi:Tfp pilus assembly protein PilP
MKTPRRNISIEIRFLLMFIFLAAFTACAFSISTAHSQGGGQTGTAPPASSPGPLQAPPGQQEPGKGSESQPSPGAAAVPDPNLSTCPPEYIPLIQKTTAALLSPTFTFIPVKALDPFVPFVTLDTTGQPRIAEEEDEQQGGAPSTPLQKMTLTEITTGLRAITWGELGRRAVIEDSTGKGYIVTVGTPAGEHSGVITQILNDRLVIQQQIWDTKARKRFPQEFVIKLVKRADDKR